MCNEVKCHNSAVVAVNARELVNLCALVHQCTDTCALVHCCRRISYLF